MFSSSTEDLNQGISTSATPIEQRCALGNAVLGRGGSQVAPSPTTQQRDSMPTIRSIDCSLQEIYCLSTCGLTVLGGVTSPPPIACVETMVHTDH
jgi:hypothetical protein